MKKMYMVPLLISIVFLLCSCNNVFMPKPTEAPTPVPTVLKTPEPKAFVYRKGELMDKLCALYGLDVALFKKIEEGAFIYAGSVSELPETVSPEQVEIAKKIIKYDPELFFVKDISLSEDGLSINISYYLEQIDAERERQELASRIDYFISNIINPAYTKFENALAAYSYLSKNITADSNENLGSYELYVKGKANSLSFAKAMQLLLSQAEIESYITNSAEGVAWVTAEINNTYYHFNPYLDAKNYHGQNLEFFGATDSEMSQHFTSWLVQDGLLEISSEDGSFSYMRNISDYGVDFTNQVIYYIDKPDNNKIVKCSYFKDSIESVYNKRAQAMVYKNSVIYFADLDNRNKLYVLDMATGEQEELDSVFVTRMYAKDGKLIYFDDVSNTEGSIVIK